MLQYMDAIYYNALQEEKIMKQFTYIIKDPNGMHARPAAILVSEAKKFNSSIKISANEKLGDLKRILSVLALGATSGTTISLTIDGEDEEIACSTLKICLENNI